MQVNLDWQHIKFKNLKNQLAIQTIEGKFRTQLKIQGNEKKLTNWIKELNLLL